MEALHQPGDIIAQRYRITDTLGQGGVGITYAAEDLKSGETVALKALSLRQMGDWKVLELFEREAKILAHLNHPAIPRYLDYFQIDTSEDRAFYIVQQLAEGKSLADLAKIGWRTNEDGVRKIASQILEILLYLHELKPPVVHRDIKPQNLIWGKDGKIFLVDFGAVQHTYRSTLAKGSTIVGTYGYMAPEQFRGQAVPATDLYGLGATVLFLMTHRSPSDLPQERLKISFRSRIQVSSGFADWLEKMLEPDVEDRFSSAKDSLAALQGRMVVAKPRRSVSWQALVGVGVAGVAAVTVLNSFKWAVLGVIGVQPSGICEAAKSGNVDIVSDYLKHGGDPTAKDNGELPMMPCLLEMENATKDIAELVIAKLSNVNTKDNEGKTPLHLARSKEIAELLIGKGADVNTKDNQGNTPLDKAFDVMYWFPVEGQRQSQIDLAKLLIGKGAYAAKVNAKDNTGETLLYRAATRKGKKELAKLLIAQGAQVNAKILNGYTPLHMAAGHDQDLAELLIAKGADVNAKANQGNTPLHAALSQKVAELLIAKGANVNAKNNEGNTPLHMARSQKVAELLITEGANVNAKNNEGDTPLHMARSQKVAELLTGKGAEVKAKNNQGETALHLAIGRFNIKLAEFLIAKGIDVDIRNNQDQTPLHGAIKNRNKTAWFSVDGEITGWCVPGMCVEPEAPNTKKIQSKDVAALLMAKGADVNAKDNQGKTPLLLAVEGNAEKDIKKNLAELLISKGADVNAKDNQGKTPLQVVISDECTCDRDTVKLLITKGASVNVKSAKGFSPLHLAAGYDWKDIAELIIAKGGQSDAKDNEGAIPLHWAVAAGWQDMTRLLIARGADINAKDNEGRSPLQWAAWFGQRDVAALLIARGAQVNARTVGGSTPLQVAAAEGHRDVAELLIVKGAEVNARRYDTGMTPLHRAAAEGHSEVAELLIAKGAKVNPRDNEGKTPLTWALKKGDKDTIALLKSHSGTE